MIDLQKYTVRQGAYTDVNKIIELINLIQPQDPWSLEYFNWQYYNFESSNTLVFLIFHQDILVSLYVAVTKKILFKGDVREGFMVQDVMTHPDHRGQGFLHYLSSLCTKAILGNGYVAYTFPNKLSENSFKRNGWTELSKTPLRKLYVNAIDNNTEKFAIEQVEQFDERVNKIWNDSDMQVGVHRDCSFLNWRYSRPQTKYYKFYILKDKGFLVLKLFANGDKKTLHLLDLVVVNSSKQCLQSVLAFVKKFASINGAELVTCWLDENHNYASIFDALGFCLDLQNDRYIFVLAPEKDLDIFSDSNLWHLTQGDSDVY